MVSGFVLIIFAFVALAGLIGGIVFISRTAIAASEQKAIESGLGGADVLTASVKDVRKGGVLVARKIGNEANVNLTIDAYNRCVFDAETWHELISEHDGKPIAIEWREGGGDSDSVYAVLPHKSDGLAAAGLAADKIDALGDDATVEIDGLDFKLKRKGQALFHRGGDGFGKKLDFWEFEATGGVFARVERPLGAAASFSLARPVDADGFDIYRLQG
jgi:hypothetical protein